MASSSRLRARITEVVASAAATSRAEQRPVGALLRVRARLAGALGVVVRALRSRELFERLRLAHTGVALVHFRLTDLARDLFQPVSHARRALLQPVDLAEQPRDAVDARGQLEIALLEVACELQELGGTRIGHEPSIADAAECAGAAASRAAAAANVADQRLRNDVEPHHSPTEAPHFPMRCRDERAGDRLDAPASMRETTVQTTSTATSTQPIPETETAASSVLKPYVPILVLDWLRKRRTRLTASSTPRSCSWTSPALRP